MLTTCVGFAAGVVVDEVVAVVGSAPLLASDLELAVLVGLAPDTDGGSDEVDRTRVLAARVRLEIQYRDLEASGVLYRLRPDVEPVLDALLARSGGEAEVARRLDRLGMTMADVEDLALRLAAVDAYVTQRLRPRITVGLDRVESTYRELVVAEYERQGATPPPLEEVRDQIYRLLVERELNDEIERWTDQAESRLEVTVFTP